VSPDALDLRPGGDGEAHAVVRGTLPDIARSLLGSEPDDGATTGLRIEGDEAALQAVAALFRDLEPDLAEPLSALLGRDMADSVVGAAEAGFAFLKSAAESVTAGLRQEARSNWVDDDAFRQLLERTEDLNLRVDRLAARVRLAEERMERPDRDDDAS
jgi:ubiquinone biosynthesis protein UbiJ